MKVVRCREQGYGQMKWWRISGGERIGLAVYLNKQNYAACVIFVIASVSTSFHYPDAHHETRDQWNVRFPRSTCTRALNEAIYAQTGITNIPETPRVIPSPWNRRIALASALEPLKL